MWVTMMNNKTLSTQEPDYEKAFTEFFGTETDYFDDSDSELDLLARADEAAAYNERYEAVMYQDYPNDFADADPFTSALLDWCENKEDNK